jgi:hypothetical protein
MAFLNLDEECAQRWPYMFFVLTSASLYLAVVLLFPKLPFFADVLCIVIFAGEWSKVLRARVTAVGLPHALWMMSLYGLTALTTPNSGYLYQLGPTGESDQRDGVDGPHAELELRRHLG